MKEYIYIKCPNCRRMIKVPSIVKKLGAKTLDGHCGYCNKDFTVNLKNVY